MKRYCLVASILVLGLFAFSPIFGEKPAETVRVSAGETETGRNGEGEKRVTERSEAVGVKSEKGKPVEKPEPEGKKDLEKGERVKRQGTKTKEPEKGKGVVKKWPPDRRWIITQRPHEKTKTPKEKPAPIKWKNKAQKAWCESGLKQLKERFLQARYYSIQGDPCRTAKYAKVFLGLVDDCKGSCPEGFLEQNGYRDSIIENLDLLYELGTKRCLGAK